MKKQVISFLLLFILTVPAVVTYSWLQMRKRAIRKEVKREIIAGINRSQLVFFEFSKKEINSKIRWQHAKEFEYNHQMYDVVEQISTTDSIQLWCWWDNKETKLNKQLERLQLVAFHTDSKTKDRHNQIVIFYKGLYYQTPFSWVPIDFKNRTALIFSKKILYWNVFFQINSPPPKFV